MNMYMDTFVEQKRELGFYFSWTERRGITETIGLQ